MKRSADLSHLRQLCSLGLPAEAVMPALLRSIRRLAPCGSAAFFWVDAQGEMTHMYAEKMLPAAATARYFGTHYERGAHPFRDNVLALARARETVHESMVDDAIETTAYYREVLEPLGAHRTLRAVVALQGTPFGQLSLYRPRGMPAFSPAERALVESACRYLVPALRAEGSALAGGDESYRDSGQAALLVCDVDGAVRQASGRGHALLAQASGCRINRYTVGGELEQAGLTLVRRLLSSQAPDSATAGDVAAQLYVANEWGRFRLRAYALGGGFGVLIERQEHLLVRLVDAMRELKLSSQQREVALWLARGLTNPQIAREMGVSLNTASYHVKQLYAKLDAHDRAGVVARILSGHTERR